MRNSYFQLIKTVWQYGQPWRSTIVFYYIAYIIAQAILGVSPYAVGRTVDALQHFKPGHLPEIIFWLSVTVIVLLVFWVFHGPARVVERKVAVKIQQSFRLSLYQRLTHLPLGWHQDHHSGNIITRLNRAALALRQFSESQFIYIEAIVKFAVSIGFLLWISVPIGLLSFFASAIVATTVILFDRKLIPLYDSENEIDNHVGAVLFDYISNMTTVLTLRLGKLTHQNLRQRMTAMWPFVGKSAMLEETKWFTMMILLSLVQAALLIGYIIYNLNASGTVLIGIVVMIFRYQWDLNTVFHDLSIYYSQLVHMDTNIQGMQPILNDIEKWAHLPKGVTTIKEWHVIEIKEMTYQHASKKSEPPIFNRIGFSIKRGEKIALIGSSGGGKSTLLNLLGGLYTPDFVDLTIDGTRFTTLELLKAITTLIPQDPEIFENTIAFNIALDLPTTPADIQQAVELAGFLPVLKGLASGLETDIREKGLNLSVGQKQRLALARGLFAARFSSLILMDEPTSSVDLPTEKTILSGVIQAFPHSALIVSLHRLHLLPQFDTVIMLAQGKVVAAGPTTDLLHCPGPVKELWRTYNEAS